MAHVRTVLKYPRNGVRMGGGGKKSPKRCKIIFEWPLSVKQSVNRIPVIKLKIHSRSLLSFKFSIRDTSTHTCTGIGIAPWVGAAMT